MLLTALALLPAAKAEAMVEISEILYDAEGEDGGQEWIEIYNGGAEAADISGWKLEKAGAAFESVLVLPAGAAIGAGAYFVIAESGAADIIEPLAFQNGGAETDGVRLLDGAGNIIDAVLYDEPNANSLPDATGNVGTAFAPDAEAGSSLARLSGRWVACFTPSRGAPNACAAPTPIATATPTATPTPTPAVSPEAVTAEPTHEPEEEKDEEETRDFSCAQHLKISEILPNPAGSDTDTEFIELYNSGGNECGVSGLKLDDAEGGSGAYAIPDGTIIAAGGRKTFYRKDTKIALNNADDRARLLYPDGAVVFELIYGKVPEGMALALDDAGKAKWTRTPTPGEGNIFSDITAEVSAASAETARPASVSITAEAAGNVKAARTARPKVPAQSAAGTAAEEDADSKAETDGQKIAGVVFCPPGYFGSDFIAVASDGGGRGVIYTGTEKLNLKAGDEVEVTGAEKDLRGENYFIVETVADIAVLAGGRSVSFAETEGKAEYFKPVSVKADYDAETGMLSFGDFRGAVVFRGSMRAESGRYALQGFFDPGDGAARFMAIGWEPESVKKKNPRVDPFGIQWVFFGSALILSVYADRRARKINGAK